LNTFDITHSEEVSSLQFSKEKSDMLLSASLDGIVCLSDTSKKDEEEAAESGNLYRLTVLTSTYSSITIRSACEHMQLLSKQSESCLRSNNSANHWNIIS
jgi:WD40 repeat protein